MRNRVVSLLAFLARKPLLLILAVDGIAVCAAIFVGFWWHDRPDRLMREGKVMTWLSFIHLLGIAGITGMIFWARRRQCPDTPVWRGTHLVWLLIALGFLFLAVDEATEIHEEVDFFLHAQFRIQETALTDRLDSVLVGGYGVIGLVILYVYRQEVRRYWAVSPLGSLGLLLFAVMIVLDLLSDRVDFFLFILSDPTASEQLKEWTNALEEGVKIIAEGLFVGAALDCLAITTRQRLPN